jgi:hypothetical protein
MRNLVCRHRAKVVQAIHKNAVVGHAAIFEFRPGFETTLDPAAMEKQYTVLE